MILGCCRHPPRKQAGTFDTAAYVVVVIDKAMKLQEEKKPVNLITFSMISSWRDDVYCGYLRSEAIAGLGRRLL
jgi:hypothetical protein